jgi:D-sedoheptulose 7-phosphate isomerase
MHNLVKLYKVESRDTFNAISDTEIEKFVEMIVQAYFSCTRIYACGNGGNAAYVGNLVTDLNLHPFVSEDKSQSYKVPRLHAINLCESVPTITAIANDIGPEFIFSEQLKIGGGRGDLVIGITGSGTSKNILEALKQAKRLHMRTIALTKQYDTPAERLADHTVVISGNSVFPGQTGKNNNNFHFEDCLSKLSHIATGILKQHIQELLSSPEQQSQK